MRKLALFTEAWVHIQSKLTVVNHQTEKCNEAEMYSLYREVKIELLKSGERQL